MVETSKDYVDLSWQCPDSDGGSALVQYIVEKRDVTRAAGAMWVVCGTVSASELSVRVGKLLQGNSYLFRVSAENRVGPGPHTEIPEPVIARLPFGMHTTIMAVFRKVTRMYSGKIKDEETVRLLDIAAIFICIICDLDTVWNRC